MRALLTAIVILALFMVAAFLLTGINLAEIVQRVTA